LTHELSHLQHSQSVININMTNMFVTNRTWFIWHQSSQFATHPQHFSCSPWLACSACHKARFQYLASSPLIHSPLVGG